MLGALLGINKEQGEEDGKLRIFLLAWQLKGKVRNNLPFAGLDGPPEERELVTKDLPGNGSSSCMDRSNSSAYMSLCSVTIWTCNSRLIALFSPDDILMLSAFFLIRD